MVMVDVAMDMSHAEPCCGTQELFPCNHALTSMIMHEVVVGLYHT